MVGRASSPAPAASRSNSNGRSRSGFPVGWRGGSGCGGRCKYVHVSSVAASMRLTPLRSLPTRPLTVSGGDQPRGRKKKSKSAWPAALCRAEPTLGCISIRYRIVDSDTDSSTHGVDLPCRPRSTPTSSSVEPSEVGRCGLAGPLAPWARGMPRAVCAGQRTRARRHRAPMDGFTACPAGPHRPAQPAEIQHRFCR